jgi:pyridoxine 4-dehydrogenase
LTAKVTQNVAVRAIAARTGSSLAKIGLAWLLARRDNVLLIPGTSSVAHLEENMTTVAVDLSQDDIVELENSV